MSAKSAHRPIALIFLLTVMTLFFLAQVFIGDLAASLTLIPQKVMQGNEWWRIATHIIAVDSYWLAFLGIPMYFWLGREVAQLTHDSIFLLGLLIGGVITGLIYTLMPIDCPPMGSGLFGMLYSASIAMTIVRSPAIIISALTKLRISILATCIIGFGFVFLGASMFSGNMIQMYTYSLESGSGIMIGLLSGLIWSHFRLASREEERVKTTESGMPLYVPIASQPIRRDEKAMINIIIDKREDILSSIMDDDMNDEDALNLILEKIYDKDIDSLSHEEIAFLERYSRSLK